MYNRPPPVPQNQQQQQQTTTQTYPGPVRFAVPAQQSLVYLSPTGSAQSLIHGSDWNPGLHLSSVPSVPNIHLPPLQSSYSSLQSLPTNGAQGLSPISPQSGPQANSASLGTIGPPPSLYGTPQSLTSSVGPSPNNDQITPTKGASSETVSSPASEDTNYILQLTAEDFHSPAIQQFLNRRPATSPSQNLPSIASAVAPTPPPTKDVPVPLETREEVVKGKTSRRSLELSESSEPFVPESVSVTKIKKEPVSDDEELQIIEPGTPPTKNVSPAAAHVPETDETGEGQRLTDG